MDREPSLELIAEKLKLTVDQVSRLRLQIRQEKPNGGWLVHFAIEADLEPEVKGKLPPQKFILISKAEANGGYDHGNG